MSTKRALCVGINVFKNYPDATLQGCVNDANDMVSLLKDKFGFAQADIMLLTDAQATKAAIMQNLTQMVADAKAGKLKTLVFSLSSHGTQLPDKSGDEKDRLDEAFCPHDLAQKGSQWDLNHIIVDDELNTLFSQLPTNTTLELYLDTCHSGTGAKGDENDMWPTRFFMPESIQAGIEEALKNAAPRGLAELLKPTVKAQRILWAGCKSDQTSADANFGGKPNGAFTYFYIKAVREAQGSITREQIIAKMQAAMKGQFTQVPQLETDALNRSKEITG